MISENGTLKVGDLWTVKVADPAEGGYDDPDGIKLQRPDGSEITPNWRNGYISHVLDIPGTYRCGDETVTATRSEVG